MDDTPEPQPPENTVDPALVTYLKRLVTALTVVMIVGVLAIVGLLVSRLLTIGDNDNQTQVATDFELPDIIRLPQGAEVTAYTRGRDWYALVTTDDQLLIFDAFSGDLRRIIELENGVLQD